MAEKLTRAQQQAVEDRGGKLLVSAAAGSGKTKVLVERLMMYITDPAAPADIDDFLIITYTKAAAAELRGKIAKALTQRMAQEPGNKRLQQQFQRLYLAKISTVHSFCADVLREYAYMLEIPGDFRMLEEGEEEPLRRQVLDRLLAEAYEHIAEDEDFAAFVDTQGVGRNDAMLPDLVLKVYDSAKCHMDSAGWLEKCIRDADVSHARDASETVWGRYLMDGLFSAIDLHLQALERAAALCDRAEGLDKMSQILRHIHSQLASLRAAKTWDEIWQGRKIDFGSVRGIGNRKNVDKDIYAMAKSVRELCCKDMEGLLRDFGNDSTQVLGDLRQILPAVCALVGLVRRFGKRYDEVKQGLRVMDFSDLEHRTLDLLLGKSRSGPTAAARQIGSRFCQIMVDEYQDSNQVQDAIFSALADGKDDLFMVGDVKQSIYQFRLADPGIFLDKYARYVSADEAKPGQGRKIVLSNNFRSGPGVIEAVNSVFSRCMSPSIGGLHYGDAEALWEGAPREPLPEPETELHVIDVAEDTYAEEAEYVAGRIEELLDGTHTVRDGEELRPIRPEDIAILLRSPKTSGAAFHFALQKRGFQTVSSHSIDLLQTEEVQWLRSLLQSVNNPHQDIPLIAALTGPVFGFGADDLASIRAGNRKVSFYEALCADGSAKTRSFLDTLNVLRQTAAIHTLPQLLEQVFSLTQADAVYAAMPDGEMRSSNLRDFYQLAVRCSSSCGDLQDFLQYLQRCENDGLRISRQQNAAGCIQITSIHKSKGLEYPVVFLCGLSRLFNMRSASATLLCDAQLGLGLSCVDHGLRIRYPSIANSAISRKCKADSISEELRVLYVAMTRPRDRLIMTFAQSGMAAKLSELAVRMELCPKELITGRANCLGTWVLYTALGRTEAGALFAAGRKPDETVVSELPWKIVYHESSAAETGVIPEDWPQRESIPAQTLSEIRQAVSFQYPHAAAVFVPSKQTATQRKGRVKDQEASEEAAPPRQTVRLWRKPEFVKNTGGRERGNAVHSVMQHIRFERCTDLDSVREEIGRLTRDGFLSAEQAALVDASRIAAFFETPLGRKLIGSGHVLREFKFSILDDASRYASDVEGEKILLQGVVDCALMEPDGITIVDFKTDRVAEENLSVTAERYRPQVETYADALSRIYELPVKASALYFFALNRFVWL